MYLKQSAASRKARKWQKRDVWRSPMSPLYVLKSLSYWDLEPCDARAPRARAPRRASRASASRG